MSKIFYQHFSSHEFSLILADHNGQRYSTAETDKHGGKRAKNTVEKDMGWVEFGALEAMRKKQQITIRLFLIKYTFCEIFSDRVIQGKKTSDTRNDKLVLP